MPLLTVIWTGPETALMSSMSFDWAGRCTTTSTGKVLRVCAAVLGASSRLGASTQRHQRARACARTVYLRGKLHFADPFPMFGASSRGATNIHFGSRQRGDVVHRAAEPNDNFIPSWLGVKPRRS